MAENKKIIISLPNSLLQEIDLIVKKEHIDRSEFVKEAMRLYIKQKRINYNKELMAKGYRDMGKINLQLAEEFEEADYQIQKKYIDKLLECE